MTECLLLALMWGDNLLPAAFWSGLSTTATPQLKLYRTLPQLPMLAYSTATRPYATHCSGTGGGGGGAGAAGCCCS